MQMCKVRMKDEKQWIHVSYLETTRRRKHSSNSGSILTVEEWNNGYQFIMDCHPERRSFQIKSCCVYAYVSLPLRQLSHAQESAFYISADSSIAHKGHRFLPPILPLLSPLITPVVYVNPALAAYFGLAYKRGLVAATEEIRDYVKDLMSKQTDSEVKEVHLMPCYRVPHYLAFHNRPANLDCAPDLAMWAVLVCTIPA